MRATKRELLQVISIQQSVRFIFLLVFIKDERCRPILVDEIVCVKLTEV